MSMNQEFSKAKSVYLPALAEKMGIPIKPQGGGFGTGYCPVCSPESNTGNKVSMFVVAGVWRWKCFACGIPPSSSIDLVALMKNIPAKEAVQLINGEHIETIPLKSAAPIPREIQETCFPEVVKKLLDYGRFNTAHEYLKKRGIGSEIVDKAVARGLVRSLPADPYKANQFLYEKLGEKLMMQTGLLKEGKKWSAIAFRPVIFPQGQYGAEFRLKDKPKNDEPKSIRYGRLITPWWWAGKDVNKVLITEGAIDALSAVQMGWNGHVMAIPGVTSWHEEWLGKIDAKFPGIEIFVGLDSDEVGSDQTNKILSQCSASNIKASSLSDLTSTQFIQKML